jgi:hypothetical protein
MSTPSVAVPAHGRRIAPAAVVLIGVVLLAAIVISLVVTVGGSGAGQAKPSTPVSPAGQQVVPSRPDLQGFTGLPRGMDGP